LRVGREVDKGGNVDGNGYMDRVWGVVGMKDMRNETKGRWGKMKVEMERRRGGEGWVEGKRGCGGIGEGGDEGKRG
jgi:hypothetical protein